MCGTDPNSDMTKAAIEKLKAIKGVKLMFPE
jgi:hypothetical protein